MKKNQKTTICQQEKQKQAKKTKSKNFKMIKKAINKRL